jgi:hypothetical protein
MQAANDTSIVAEEEAESSYLVFEHEVFLSSCTNAVKPSATQDIPVAHLQEKERSVKKSKKRPKVVVSYFL